MTRRRMIAKRLTLFFTPIMSWVIFVDSGAVNPRACSVVITRIWRETWYPDGYIFAGSFELVTRCFTELGLGPYWFTYYAGWTGGVPISMMGDRAEINEVYSIMIIIGTYQLKNGGPWLIERYGVPVDWKCQSASLTCQVPSRRQRDASSVLVHRIGASV